MITKDLRKLLEKLNDHTTRNLEAAAGFAIGRGHYEVSIEHLFLKLLLQILRLSLGISSCHDRP